MQIIFNNDSIQHFQLGTATVQAEQLPAFLTARTQALFDQYLIEPRNKKHTSNTSFNFTVSIPENREGISEGKPLIQLKATDTTEKAPTEYTDSFISAKGERRLLRQIEQVKQFIIDMGLIKSAVEKGDYRAAKEWMQNRADKSSAFMAQLYLTTNAGGDGLSFVRQLLNALYINQTVASIVNYAGVASGSIWGTLALYDIFNGYWDRKEFQNIHYREGVERATAHIASGALGAAASAVYLAGKGVEFAINLECAAAFWLNVASSILFGLGATISVALHTFGIYRCRSFRAQLDQYRNYAYEGTPQEIEIQQLKGTLSFLKHLATNDAASVHYLKSRTSARTLQEIIHSVDRLLQELNDPLHRKGAIEAAKKLIDTVRSDNVKKEILHWVSLIVTLIGIAAYIASCIVSAGIAPFVLFCICAAVLLVVGGYQYFSHPKLQKEQDPLTPTDALPVTATS